MTNIFRMLLLVAALGLAACSRPALVPLGGVSIDNRDAVAQIREGSMFLRGLDKKRLELKEMPNPMGNYVFAVSPGQHALLAMNIQAGHVIPYEGMRCYILEADMKAGVTYRLDEDKEKQRAVLKREDTGVEVAAGEMVSQQSAYSDVCQWK
ncbi:MAG: hypothetical protein VB032_08685 [Burkholderiaceae bacterium]|nr:hypothetical protein [Burkholderiaceae bacterium]